MSRHAVIIPARHASSRLPGKPLIPLCGVPMLVRTWQRCTQAVDPARIWVATDDIRIEALCRDHGIQVLMTSPDCLTGTDRVAEAAGQLDADVLVNVQGDEPLFDPDDLRLLIAAVDRHPGEVLNGYCAIDDAELFFRRSIPKVVFRPDGRLLYMSRSGIPGTKAGQFSKGWRQVCAYAFPRAALQAFASQTTKTPLEAEEDIEILRFLELGYEVRMLAMSSQSIAVDMPDDVHLAEHAIRARGLA
ncbi:3-deoxy-manno-octulosonate cytidylyltransferase [Nevskia sp.]|uniref:3-deoxy-manno-octulosonate cytidylyltransferase n=1 Tax=Nevskia sp. TaxID=1929292 RepID=UPI003F71AC4E